MFDWIYILKAFFLGLIEGLTEFLPISSTGHLILVSNWIKFQSNEARVFEVVIQLGAILAVCWLYRHKLISLFKGVMNRDSKSLHFSFAVALAFLPAAVIGALFIDEIKAFLFNPMVVSISLIVGGVIIIVVEQRKKVPSVDTLEHISFKQAFGIGFGQCVAMIPGVSRSGATIIGGILSGVSRKAATEFSFFLAIPTMLGASTLDLYKHYDLLNNQDFIAIAVGFLAAFFTALLVVKAMVQFVAKHTLIVFAIYRIILGLVILSLLII